MSESSDKDERVTSSLAEPAATSLDVPAGLRRARTLAHLLDTSLRIPGTRFRFGLDALLGLVPGLGDAVGTALAAYIVGVAIKLGAPGTTLLRMLWNIAVEAFGGSVPVVGDVFDAAWRSNVKNVRLLERHLNLPAAGERAERITVLTIGVGLLALVGLSAWVSLKVALWIVGLFSVAGVGLGG